MKTLNFSTSACRVCRYYRPEGRRGGLCQQLGVPVNASWKACSLAIPAFTPSWESIKEMLENEKVVINETVSANCAGSGSKLDLPKVKTYATSEPKTADVVLV